MNSGRVQVFDRRQTPAGENILSCSIETLSLSTTSPVVSLQYIQKNTFFQFSGLIVGSNDKSGFYEHVPDSEYRYHPLPLDSKLFFFLNHPNSFLFDQQLIHLFYYKKIYQAYTTIQLQIVY